MKNRNKWSEEDDNEAIFALLDILDGVNWYDLVDQCGLRKTRCEQICALKSRLLSRYQDEWLNRVYED